jgi:dienelactone hydrolase
MLVKDRAKSPIFGEGSMKITVKRIVLIAIAAFLLVSVASAAVYAAFGIHYPTPEGEYKVGCTRIFMTDKDRLEVFSDAPDDLRELPVTVYYPAEPAKGDAHAKFASKAVEEVLSQAAGCPVFILDSIQPNSYIDAVPVADKTFPVLLFSGGLYGQMPFYGSLLESVAAEGYIVVTVEHPYSETAVENSAGDLIRYTSDGTAKFDSGADNATLEKYANELCDIWTADMLFVFDSLSDLNTANAVLKGSMDLSKTGIFGHSFGGAAAIQCLQERQELAAGINMDGSIYGKQKTTPVRQPFVFMNNAQEAVISAICFQEKIEASLTSEACYHMILLDSTHDSFATDSGLLYDKYPFLKWGDVADINGKIALYSLTAYITAFFDQYIKGEPSEMLEAGCSAEYPVFLSSKYED